MKNRFLWCASFLCFGLFAGLAQPSQAQTARELATVRQEIEAESRYTDDFVLYKNIKALMRYYADDFQGQGIGGDIYNKKQAEQNLTKLFGLVKTIRSHSEMKNLRLDHGKAVILGEEHTTVEIVSKKNGQIHKVVFTGEARSTMVKRNGIWQIWRETHLTQTVSRDGVVVSKKP